MAAVAHGRGGARGTKETPPTDTPGNRSAIVFVHIRNRGRRVMANWWDGIVPPTKSRDNEKLWELWKNQSYYTANLGTTTNMALKFSSSRTSSSSSAIGIRRGRWRWSGLSKNDRTSRKAETDDLRHLRSEIDGPNRHRRRAKIRRASSGTREGVRQSQGLDGDDFSPLNCFAYNFIKIHRTHASDGGKGH